MKKINLHTHSKYSLDAKLGINEIINQAFENGISYLSITDHDTCDAYLDLDVQKISNSGTIIYGMEADALVDNITYDILCYGFNIDKISLWAKEQYGTVNSRQSIIFENLEYLCKNLNLKIDNSTPFNSQKEYAHAAIYRMIKSNDKNKEFLCKYNIKNISDLYRESTMNPNFPLYIDMSIVWPKIETLAQIIHENGGKIFLAHPYKYNENTDVDKLLNSCLPYIDGIEISNEPQSPEEVNYLYKFAKRNNLLVSAGSDYHGTEKHNDFNVYYLTEDMTNDIENWIKKINGKVTIYHSK